MELKQIKDLMTAMVRSGIKKLSLKETSGFEIQLETHDDHPSPPPATSVSHSPYAHPHHFPSREVDHHRFIPPPAHPNPLHTEENKGKGKEEGKFIVSPMVGTFYGSPSPDDPQYLKVGDKVDENTIVCIIEAMKVMNEVKAGMSGTVAEVLVDNAHPVEFGTKMFRIV